MNVAMDDLADDALVREAKKGSLEAFSALCRRYQERVYFTILRFTKNPVDADDLTQETFMSAFKSLGQFKKKSTFYTWIYRIAVNKSLNFLKKKDRERELVGFEDNRVPGESSPGAAGSPERSSIGGETAAEIERAIDALPPSFKAPFVLVVNQGLSHREAAEALGCSENAVSWRMHKARKLLRARLERFLNGSRK